MSVRQKKSRHLPELILEVIYVIVKNNNNIIIMLYIIFISTLTGADCPIGTFSNESSLTEEAQCTDCTPGMYCDTPGLTQPAGECEAGHFCASRATRYAIY